MSRGGNKPQPPTDEELLYIIDTEDIVEVIELDDDDFADLLSSDENNDDDDDQEEGVEKGKTGNTGPIETGHISTVIAFDNTGVIESDDTSAIQSDDTGAIQSDDTGAVQSDNTVVFKGHGDAVFCVSIEPVIFKYAVTGGQDDKAIVWNVKTGETVFECTGHKDSVTAVGFSHDGDLIATGDLGGFIQVWDFATQQVVWEFECSDIEWLKWHHNSHVLFAGTSDGNFWMFKISSEETKTFPGHGPSAASGVICPDGKRACVGYQDGVIKIWNLEKTTCVHTISGANAHASSVVSLACHHDNVLIVSGATDNTAKLINTETGKVVATLPCSGKPGAAAESESVEAVGFSPVMPWVATGNLTGELEIWDLSSHIVRQRCHHERGIVKLMWDKESPFVYTASLDGQLQLWDARNGEIIKQWKGHTAEILDFDISFKGHIIITTSEDKTARVFPSATSGKS
ncbi:angio-associated migratory cell protein-like [Gigantopelta aegis]|uniref:angio-associated migratory cell protein-like n=1 Tax=Gigantopelta aegis TaxID=1735272 RepID=UPI001B88C146|nr:angio-associated migratory cell protein-like [Gigantopelta aegis]